ncbi:MAG: exosortase/archaeosortase family protein [Verrucomicrobiales bacterium]
MNDPKWKTMLPLAGWMAFWLPAMLGAAYSWRNGEYYDYGWFVPPAALWLLVRRWNGVPAPLGVAERSWLPGFFLLLPWLLVLRVVSHVDPNWRLPVGLLGLTAALMGHWIFARVRGWNSSTTFWKITLLMLSTIPWPSAVESRLVHGLTDQVVSAAAELFRLVGQPVEVVGERMTLNDMVVEVTDGCSGVRSFQSFLMATWFFAELQRLNLTNTLKLLLWGLVAAFAVNLARACALAQIRFIRGEAAAESAHDLVGLLAFLGSAVFFYWFSGRLDASSRRRVARRIVQ